MNKNITILILTACAFATLSSHAMRKKFDDVKNSGQMSLSTNVRAISDGVGIMLSDPSTLTSSACLIGWHTIANNSRSGFFDTATLKDPQVLYSLAGGIVGKTIKSTITADSYMHLPSPIRLVLSHPFLSTYVGLHCYFKFNEFKNNPAACLAELGLLGVHFLSEQWGY